jgi:ferredoxin/flavodoxin---NADP+ reductase
VPTNASSETDLLIIGAGPVGLFGAFYAGLRGLSVTMLDALPTAGGQISAMYPEKDILDVAGFPRVKGRDLVADLVAQAEPFSPTYLLEQEAVAMATHDDGVVVSTRAGLEVRAKAVLLTGGIGSFSPKPLPAAAGWTGDPILHFVEHPAYLASRDVVIVGGGDSAVDWALMLAPIALSVTIVHRRDRFRAHAGLVDRVRDLGVQFVVPAEVTKLIGTDGHLEAVEVTDTKSKDVRTLTCSAIVAALGFHAELGPLAEWGLTLAGRHVVVDSTGSTGIDRVYAAGDLVTYPGKVALLATGFGEVATAVNNAAARLDPHSSLFPGHTTAITDAEH